MAFAVFGDLMGGNAQMDEDMQRQLGISPDSPPSGAIARFAGPVASGWRILSVWESREAWDTFRRERLEPWFRQAGRELPSLQTWEIHSYQIAERAPQRSR